MKTTFTPPPPALSEDITKRAAREFYADNDLEAFGEVEQVAEDLCTQFYMGIDGYELASRLDLNRNWFGVCAQTVEVLDSFTSKVGEVLREERKKWALDNNIQPPHAVGTRITIGTITGICTHAPATYLVKEDGCTDPNRSRLVRFEDADTVEAHQ